MSETEKESIKERIDPYPKFTLKTSDIIDLKSLFKLSANITDEISVNADHEGLNFRSMDNQHVCLLDAKLNPNSFEKWNISKDGIFGFYTEEVNNYFKTLDNKEPVEIIIESDQLVCKTRTSINKLRLTERSFDIPMPKITYNATVGINLKAFKKILKKASLISDYIQLNATNQGLEISSFDKDKGEFKEVILKGSSLMPELDIKEDSISNYSLEYIELFTKCYNDDIILKLEFSSRKPLRLTLKLGLNEIQYYQAPRVEN